MSTTTNNSIVTFSFCESFLNNFMDYLEVNFLKEGRDLSRLAIVFGGKRPALFVKRELGRRMKGPFFPPRFFTIDEFMAHTVYQKERFSAVNDLDNCFWLYQLARDTTPEILKGRESFAKFLPWTREIASFIDQLDLEQVPENALKNIAANAHIGYPVPEDINRLLEHVVTLRKACHQFFKEKKIYSRGFQYLRAAQVINDVPLKEFDRVLFCNFFYLHKSEEAVMKNLYERRQATLLFQGDERRWPVLKRISKSFLSPLHEADEPARPQFNLKLYAGFDVHSQMGLVREILKTIKEPDKTVIVLPSSDHVVPLLSEIAYLIKDFNVSMGYPLKRSSLYTLFEFVFKAQLSRKAHRYYARDYLKALRHPFVKNLKLSSDPSVTRIFIHKIEEILTGKEKTSLSGSLFFELEDIESLDELYMVTLEMLDHLGIRASRDELLSILEKIHAIFFESWENLKDFHEFATVLGQFLDVMIEKSFLKNYPLNLTVANKMYAIRDEFLHASFKREHFALEEMFRIFESKVSQELVAFQGQPLKGLQILGLFETRSLNFENVIVVDVNEGVLPKLRIYEPLIPREVMISLNLDRLELEEEIQRYQFMRLISSAKNVHLVYQEAKDKEKSRFVEELIWDEEKYQEKLKIVPVTRANFEVQVVPRKVTVAKTPAMIESLRNHTYSASSINTYLRDPLEFYYNYVLKLKEVEDLLDEPEARHVGTFVHELLEAAFFPYLKKKPDINAAFRNRFTKLFEQKFHETFERSMKSDSFLLKAVLMERLNRFLDNEQFNDERQVDEILYLENRFEDTVDLSMGPVKFRYIVDRVDRLKDGTIMIVDYKTGGIDQMPKAIDKIAGLELSRENIRDAVRSFQIPLYFHYLDKQFKDKPIDAALYNLRTLTLHKFMGKDMSFSRQEIHAAFLRALDFVVAEILDPDVPFEEDESARNKK